METGDSGALSTAIGFELLVFERSGDAVRVTVRGMTSAAEIGLLVFETPTRASISPVGSWAEGHLREYALRTDVEVEPGKVVVVQGAQGAESIVAADLPEDLPVVCSADPTSADLPDQFLHRRGVRYVLMDRGEPVRSGPRAHRTTLVA